MARMYQKGKRMEQRRNRKRGQAGFFLYVMMMTWDHSQSSSQRGSSALSPSPTPPRPPIFYWKFKQTTTKKRDFRLTVDKLDILLFFFSRFLPADRLPPTPCHLMGWQQHSRKKKMKKKIIAKIRL